MDSQEYMSEHFDIYSNNNNNNNNTWANLTDEEEEAYVPYQIPLWRQLVWSVFFCGMVIVATTGNVVVVWIVLAHKRMRSVTNYLLVSLSVADTLASTINVIPNYIYMLQRHWPFGVFYCKFVQFVAVLSICASVFSLMAIAFDRYMVIVYPLKPRMGKKLILGIAAGIWIISSILAFPMLLFFTTFEVQDAEVCIAVYPDGPMTKSYIEYLYNIFFMLLTYFVPIGVMLFTYVRVGILLWGSQSIGEITQRQLENVKSKRRVVKMMIVVVIIFGICWLPFHIYFIVVSKFPELTNLDFVQEIYLGIYFLAMSNQMVNPLIYCWMNSRFRNGFKHAFSWCPFIHYTDIESLAPAPVTYDVRRDRARQSVTGTTEVNTRFAVIRNGPSIVPANVPLQILSSNLSNSKPIKNSNHDLTACRTQKNNNADALTTNEAPSLLCVNKTHNHNTNDTSFNHL